MATNDAAPSQRPFHTADKMKNQISQFTFFFQGKRQSSNRM